MNSELITFLSTFGGTGAIAVVAWVTKFATVMVQLAESVDHINNSLKDHETRIRTMEQKP